MSSSMNDFREMFRSSTWSLQLNSIKNEIFNFTLFVEFKKKFKLNKSRCNYDKKIYTM